MKSRDTRETGVFKLRLIPSFYKREVYSPGMVTIVTQDRSGNLKYSWVDILIWTLIEIKQTERAKDL